VNQLKINKDFFSYDLTLFFFCKKNDINFVDDNIQNLFSENNFIEFSEMSISFESGVIVDGKIIDLNEFLIDYATSSKLLKITDDLYSNKEEDIKLFWENYNIFIYAFNLKKNLYNNSNIEDVLLNEGFSYFIKYILYFNKNNIPIVIIFNKIGTLRTLCIFNEDNYVKL